MKNHLNLIKFYVSLIESKAFGKRGINNMRLIPKSVPDFLANQHDAVEPQGGRRVKYSLGAEPARRLLNANTASIINQSGIDSLTSDSAADLSLTLG